MNQFEYSNIYKFKVSVGTALIAFSFLLPWLYLRENFGMLVSKSEFESLTINAQNIILQKQALLNHAPIISLILCIFSLFIGIFLVSNGIKKWNEKEKRDAENDSIKNKIDQARIPNPNAEKIVSNDKYIEIDNTNPPIFIKINNLWHLNHWGSSVAKIKDDIMIFEGEHTRLDSDGSHIDLIDVLSIGSKYLIQCDVQSSLGTTGEFQLWCHDGTGINENKHSVAIPYSTPKNEWETINLEFEAKYSTNLRIHFQYKPGKGRIFVKNLRLIETNNH